MNVKSVEGILVIISVAVSIIASGCTTGDNSVGKDNNPVIISSDTTDKNADNTNQEKQTDNI